mmetsp:Transcript_83333/g.222841  ORF Transcript_83333/g.222841 Transcript_83333/m.222841 type:complete len:373 (+) Transcript_83333:89-1207(+)
MRVIAASVAVCGAVLRGSKTALELESYTFEDFERDFARKYDTEERENRRKIVEKNLEFVRTHNKKQGATWTAGVNELTDRTEEEFEREFTGLDSGMRFAGRGRAVSHLSHRVNVTKVNTTAKQLPASVDWRQKGVVTPVMRQGACGSCWAVAAAGALESHLAIANGSLQRVAAGALRDCVQNPKACGGEGGCRGAVAQLAYNWTQQNGVIMEADYAYSDQDGVCVSEHTPKRGKITGYKQLPANQGEPLKEALAQTGPVTVSVAVPSSFRSYSSGVLTCGDSAGTEDWKISHAVLAVGYGSDPTYGPYWLLKNSWGARWGEEGYLRVARQDGSEPCGTDVAPELGFSCKPYPESIKVCGHCGVLSDSSYPVV